MERLSSAIRSYIVLTIVYILLIIVLPANKVAMQQYHLSSHQYHILLFVAVLPILAVWLAAFYGYAKLKDYANSITSTPEGADFQQLASGSMWLAWRLPVISIISILVGSVANAHPGFHPTAVIVVGYLSLLISLAAFSFMSEGSRGLLKQARQQISMNGAKIVIVIFVLLGVVYCYFSFQHLDLHQATSTNNPYYLPVWLMVLTIIIPYLYAWFIGLLAAYEIMLFGNKAKGVLYRRPLQILALGLVAVILASIILQYITSVEPRSGHLSLNTVLATTYIVQFIGAAGYLLIASGARKLKKIEEV